MTYNQAEKFSIEFATHLKAKGLFLEPPLDLYQSFQELGLRVGHPTLVVIGGAQLFGSINESVRNLFTTVLAPIAEKWGANVIDGGTNSGVMRLMGEARAAHQGTFPLIGVVPADLAVIPNGKACSFSEEDGSLEPNHTHFFLVPGEEWGDESAWLAEVATALASGAPSVTVLINGGEITWKDAQANVAEDRTIIVIEGTGRTADLLAAATHGHKNDDRANLLVQSGLVKITNLKENASILYSMIEDIFQHR